MKSCLNSLELLQEAMEASSKGALEQMNFVFGIAAALVGVFGLYSLYRQTVAEASRDKHEEEMRGLVGSFRDNMSAVNSLIGTLESSFKHRALVDEQIHSIGKQLTDIATFKSNIEQTLAEKVAELNAAATARYFDAKTAICSFPCSDAVRGLTTLENALRAPSRAPRDGNGKLLEIEAFAVR